MANVNKSLPMLTNDNKFKKSMLNSKTNVKKWQQMLMLTNDNTNYQMVTNIKQMLTKFSQW